MSKELAELRAEVERYPWYHTIELADGVVTPGMFDHRPVVDRYVIKRFRFNEKRPMAELDGIDHFELWVTNLAELERVVRAAGFARVEASEPFELPYRAGGEWAGLRGAVRAFV